MIVIEENSPFINEWILAVSDNFDGYEYLESYRQMVVFNEDDTRKFVELDILRRVGYEDRYYISPVFTDLMKSIGCCCELGSWRNKTFLLFDKPDAITVLKLMV